MLTKESISAYADILNEVARAKKLHPRWPCDVFRALSILSEEMGEAHNAALEAAFRGDEPGKVREEVVQLGAMCVRFLEGWEFRNRLGPGEQL
jgi:hypothetical protein